MSPQINLTGYTFGNTIVVKDGVRLKAAETLGKHYGLFTDRLAVEAPVRSSEEIMSELKERLVLLKDI